MSLKDTLSTLMNAGTLSLDGPAYPVLMRSHDMAPRRGGGEQSRMTNLFHFMIWLRANGVVDYRVVFDGTNSYPVVEATQVDQWLLFGKKQDRDAFLRWLEHYKTWFVDVPMTETYFPALPSRGEYTLAFVEAPVNTDWFTAEQYTVETIDHWVWVVQNCRHPVYVGPKGFAFTNTTEAIHYKLAKDGIEDDREAA